MMKAEDCPCLAFYRHAHDSIKKAKKIRELQEEIEKLKSDRAVLVECVKFYSTNDHWATHSESKKPCFKDCISSIDVERIQTSKTSWLYVAGKKARETLKKVGEL